jgi:hypothetical protein
VFWGVLPTSFEVDGAAEEATARWLRLVVRELAVFKATPAVLGRGL